MSNEADWERVKDVFSLALDIAPRERDAFVRSECGSNEPLHRAVLSWLDSYAEADDFIEEPALNLAKVLSAPTAAGKQFGKYRILNEIGAGGMGAVFLAERSDGEFTQQVAIKIVRQSIAESHVIDRFLHERQILASLNHPNIAKLLDGGLSDNNEPYLAMEYVQGEQITDYVRSRSLSLNDTLKVFLKVCSAVAYAHRSLVVHRDIKPGNILVTADGEPKLLDFGLAKLVGDDLRETGDRTQTAFRALTPSYASPEQLRGDPITTASDVYSLGVVLYEIVTGRRPFNIDGKDLNDIIRGITTSAPPPPSSEPATAFTRQQLKGDLDNIILKALRIEPERRYESVEKFAEDIGRHLDGLPVTARKDTYHYRASKFVLRHRAAVVAASLVFITLVTGVTLTVREKRKADRRFSDVRQLANSLMFEVDDEIQKGPTKGRAMIAKRALEYLDSLAIESGNEEDLQLELAAGYLKVGDTQGKPYRPNLGDTAGAAASYKKAQALLRPLLAADPADREAQYLLSLSHQSLGRVQERTGEWEAAYDNEREAVDLSESLLAAEPANARTRNLLADNYLHFGEALYQTGRGATVADHHEAIEYFRKALAIHLSLAGERPDNADYRYAAGVDYEYIGIAFNRLGRMTEDAQFYASALENHLKELEINEALAASDPSNAAYRRIVADVYGEVGLSQLHLGRTAEALGNFRHRLAIFESIKASDPTNVEAIRDLVNALIEVKNAFEQAGDKAGALAQLRRAIPLQQALCDAEPDNAETRNQLRSLTQMAMELE